MFERFNESARQVVVLAQDEARALGHNYIGTEHLLLGLTLEGESIGAGVLERLGLSREIIRDEIERLVGPGPEMPAGQIPFTRGAKKTLELALREALHLGNNHIGTEHLVLALARVDEGIASEILLAHGISRDEVEREVIRAQGSAEWTGGAWEYRLDTVPSGSDANAWIDRLRHEGWEILRVRVERRRRRGAPAPPEQQSS